MSVIMLTVIMMSVIMLSVVAPTQVEHLTVLHPTARLLALLENLRLLWKNLTKHASLFCSTDKDGGKKLNIYFGSSLIRESGNNCSVEMKLFYQVKMLKNFLFVFQLGNCDIHFFNFRHWKVQNFEILNLFERNQNFAAIFWKYRKLNWKSTKYLAISWTSSVKPLKFCEMSLVLWNLINYCSLM